MISSTQLVIIYPLARARIATFINPLIAAMDEFQINTPLRIAAFLAQVGQESGQLLYVKELASGAAYEGRKDLGNTQAGDGVRYKGRGLIQVTGRANYAAMQAALNVPCIDHPELLETPINACRSAAQFWFAHGLNALADEGNFMLITKRINGGVNGLAARVAYYNAAKTVLGI
jgi:putative chitinase